MSNNVFEDPKAIFRRVIRILCFQPIKQLAIGNDFILFGAVNHLQNLYQGDLQFARLVKIFSWITIFISILGLYGLIALICKQRMKEIGVRKILGASVKSLTFTLSKSFLGLVLVANVMVWPLVYWFARNWMNNFAYQVDIDVRYFALALAITLLVAAITLFSQTSKASLINPVETLKHE